MTFVLEATDGSAGDEQINLPNYETPEPLPIPNSPHGGTQERYPENHQVEARSPRVLENRSQLATSSPFSPFSDDGAALSLREASLMRYFIQKIAPWVS